MQRGLTALIAAGTVALPVTNAAAALAASAPAKTAVRPVKRVTTQKFTGPEAQADRWGTVRITITVRKTTITTGKRKRVTRKYTGLGGGYTYHTGRSQFIMEQALPILRQEFLQAQSANIQMVSGATYTSQAFLESLQAALLQAQKS